MLSDKNIFRMGWSFFFIKQYRRIIKQWWGIRRNYSYTMDYREDGETKKITKQGTNETFYRQWEETVVGLKMHIYWKHVQVRRKHYLLQVRRGWGWLMTVSDCFTPGRNIFTFEFEKRYRSIQLANLGDF